jgi:hypothetical protein
MPPQILLSDSPPTARDLSCFQSIRADMTMVDVVKRCGIPDEHVGSGIYIFVYHLRDGGSVAVGTPDLKRLFDVTHTDANGKSSTLFANFQQSH